MTCLMHVQNMSALLLFRELSFPAWLQVPTERVFRTFFSNIGLRRTVLPLSGRQSAWGYHLPRVEITAYILGSRSLVTGHAVGGETASCLWIRSLSLSSVSGSQQRMDKRTTTNQRQTLSQSLSLSVMRTKQAALPQRTESPCQSM